MARSPLEKSRSIDAMGSPPALELAHARRHLPCLLCGGEQLVDLHRKDPWRIVRCARCTLVFTLPRLPAEELRAMYQDDYWKSSSARDFGYTDYLGDAELYRRTFALRLRWIRKHCAPPARLLDVGCAAGFALEVFARAGYDVRGVELSASMARIAAQRVGEPRVHAGVLTEDVFPGLKFDLITLFDVVEHVEDPIALLDLARRRLHPGGCILLETQNVSSWFARLLGIRWQHYKFHEHLYHFDPRTVRALLQRAGLEIDAWTRRYGGKYVSFRFIAERAGRLHPWIAALLRPLQRMPSAGLYINVFDEMLVAARAHG